MRVFAMVTTSSSSAYTRHALSSFFKYTELRPFDFFYLIDNDSDYEISNLGFDLPTNFRLYKNSSAKSFAANANQGIEWAMEQGADLFFLNNDLIFSKNWLQPLLTPQRAILSPISNREILKKLNDFQWSNHLYLNDYLSRQIDFDEIVDDHYLNYNGYQNVLSLPFYCIKIPYLVFSELGKFDESFGKGGAEDNDYCLRAGINEIPVKYALKSYILHFSGKSTWDGAEDKAAAQERRKLFTDVFINKWGRALSELLLDEKNEILNSLPENIKISLEQDKVKPLIEYLIHKPN